VSTFVVFIVTQARRLWWTRRTGGQWLRRHRARRWNVSRRFERTGWPNDGTKEGGQQYFDWFKHQFWRFVFVQQLMAKEIQTFLEYPPMQRGASFNLHALKAEMATRMAQAEAAAKGPSN
jgi:hypothetical protein